MKLEKTVVYDCARCVPQKKWRNLIVLVMFLSLEQLFYIILLYAVVLRYFFSEQDLVDIPFANGSRKRVDADGCCARSARQN